MRAGLFVAGAGGAWSLEPAGQLVPAARRLRADMRVDPGLDVRHDPLLADVGQQIIGS